MTAQPSLVGFLKLIDIYGRKQQSVYEIEYISNRVGALLLQNFHWKRKIFIYFEKGGQVGITVTYSVFKIKTG